MKPFARRIADIEPFRVVEVLNRAQQLEQQGRRILHLEAGEPDFATAQSICDAGAAALQAGHTKYSAAVGIMPLRQALADYYAQDYGVQLDPRRIIITPGASGALLLVAALLMERDQGMLMADPGYPCNRHFMRLVEGQGQLVPVGPAERYQLNAVNVAAAWQPNTMGAMVASPANPTGEILDRHELEALYQCVAQRGGVLVVDEIYHGLDYDAKAPTVLAVTDQAYVINSFSKYFGMTGWRLGWLVAPSHAVDALERLAQNLFISMSTPAQYAALACFAPATRAVLDQRRDAFKQRRDYLLPELRRLGFGIANVPAGGLYLYADVSGFTDDSEAFCRELLEQYGVAITPGVDFGQYRARQHVRFAFTTDMDNLRTAVEQLQLFIAQRKSG